MAWMKRLFVFFFFLFLFLHSSSLSSFETSVYQSLKTDILGRGNVLLHFLEVIKKITVCVLSVWGEHHNQCPIFKLWPLIFLMRFGNDPIEGGGQTECGWEVPKGRLLE